MANIAFANLFPAGVAMFVGSESYMTDVSDHDLEQVSGGFWTPFHLATPATLSSVTCAYTIMNN